MVRYLRNSSRRIPLPVSTIDQKSFLNQLEAEEEKSLVKRKLPQNNLQENISEPESDPIQPKMAKKIQRPKIEMVEDDRVRAHVKFLKRLGYKTEISDLHIKNPNFLHCHNNSPEEVFRCQDEFRMNSELKNIIKGQSISKCPFGVKTSSKKTNEIFSRISAIASKKRSNQKSSVRKSK